MDTNLSKAIDSCYKRDYQKALLYFSLALKANPNSKDARVGAILSDFALEREEEAEALFEYYLVSKNDEKEEYRRYLEEIIDIVDNSSSINNLFDSINLDTL